jgi:hypothetical protein
MWFAYFHCLARNVFSMGLLRDYTHISSPIINQKSVAEPEREGSETSAAKEEGFG